MASRLPQAFATVGHGFPNGAAPLSSWPGLSHGCPVGVLGPLELHLVCVEVHGDLGIEQAVEPPAMHQVGAYEASEGKRAGDGFLGCLSEAQKQEGDEGYGDLDAHGILGGAEKA